MDFSFEGDKVKIRLINGRILERGIQRDEEGRQFFYVPNLLNHPEVSILRVLFLNRVKDMVDTVRNGDGDCIYSGGVMRYIDREIGEQIRERTLQKWENVTFGFAFFYETIPISTNGDVCVNSEPIMSFASEDAARAYLDAVEDEAKRLAAVYAALKTEDEKSDFLAIHLSPSLPQLLWKMRYYHMAAADGVPEGYPFEIGQCVINT